MSEHQLLSYKQVIGLGIIPIMWGFLSAAPVNVKADDFTSAPTQNSGQPSTAQSDQQSTTDTTTTDQSAVPQAETADSTASPNNRLLQPRLPTLPQLMPIRPPQPITLIRKRHQITQRQVMLQMNLRNRINPPPARIQTRLQRTQQPTRRAPTRPKRRRQTHQPQATELPTRIKVPIKRQRPRIRQLSSTRWSSNTWQLITVCTTQLISCPTRLF